MSLILAGTGHRPGKIAMNGQNAYAPAVYARLVDLAEAALKRHNPQIVISGMALGWDMALADAALRRGIALHAYVPHDDHDSRWPTDSRTKYHHVLTHATHVEIVCPGPYAPWKMQKRNEAMVDALVSPTDVLLAMWDGSSGGTYNCIQYARRVRADAPVPVVNLWNSWLRHAQAASLEPSPTDRRTVL